MTDIALRTIEANGIHIRIAEAGEGPAVLMLHGFPESWYSYRHQLRALAGAGFRVIAPDMRGYGGTDRPQGLEKYTQLHFVGDAIGVLDALQIDRAVVVGHDWGGPVAWNTALLRPDRVRGVVGLSVPYIPRRPVSMPGAMRSATSDRFYQQYFQAPGVAEAELEKDVRVTVRKALYSASGSAPEGVGWTSIVPDEGFLAPMVDPDTLPAWLTGEDVDYFTAEFERTGFTGGLNWYRGSELSSELMGAWTGAQVRTPALYVVGDRDVVYSFPGVKDLIPALNTFVPKLTETIVLPGCGHWTQQERPDEVNEALLRFLSGL